MSEEIVRIRRAIFNITAHPIEEEKLGRIRDHEARIEELVAELSQSARELQAAISNRASGDEISVLREKMGFQGRRINTAQSLLAKVRKELEKKP